MDLSLAGVFAMHANSSPIYAAATQFGKPL